MAGLGRLAHYGTEGDGGGQEKGGEFSWFSWSPQQTLCSALMGRS